MIEEKTYFFSAFWGEKKYLPGINACLINAYKLIWPEYRTSTEIFNIEAIIADAEKNARIKLNKDFELKIKLSGIETIFITAYKKPFEHRKIKVLYISEISRGKDLPSLYNEIESTQIPPHVGCEIRITPALRITNLR